MHEDNEIDVFNFFDTQEDNTPIDTSADDLNSLVEKTRQRITTFSDEVNVKLEQAESQLHSNDATMWEAVRLFGQPNHTDTSAMATAKAMNIAGVDQELARLEMEEVYATQYDEQSTERAIRRVIEKAYNTESTRTASAKLPYACADLKEGCLDRLADLIEGVEPLTEQAGEHQTMTPLDFIEHLDQFNDRLWCVSGALTSGEYRHYKDLTTANVDTLRDKFENDSHLVHMVANPMTTPTGKTQEGKTSQRSKENSTVDGQDIAINIEMDTATIEQQLQFAQYLIDLNLPVIWVAFSGSKSVHTRVSTVGLSHQQIMTLKRWAVSHGADSSALRTHQLVRLPNGMRGDTKQKCYYFDPTKIDAEFTSEMLEALGASTSDLLTEKEFDEELLYNQNTGKFYHKNALGEYFPDSSEGYRLSMREEGLEKDAANTRMHNAKMHNSFSTSLEIAGWRRGLRHHQGQRYFIPIGYRPPTPKRGDWSMVKGIIERLFGDEQVRYLYSQLKEFSYALLTGTHSQFAAIAICGEASSGKTLFVDNILAGVVNARIAQGEKVIKGNTDFNSDVMGAEVVTLDDVKGNFGKEAKAVVTAEIKKQVATSSKMYHAKGKDKVPVEPTQLLVMSLNTDDEDLAILPSVGRDGSDDKFSIYLVEKHPMPMPTDSVASRAAFNQRIKDELPAFLHFLLHEWEVPEDVKSSRFITYHNEDIYDRLVETTEDNFGFVEIVEFAIWNGNDRDELIGSTQDIMTAAINGVQNDRGRSEVLKGFIKSPTAFGRNLTKHISDGTLSGERFRTSKLRGYKLTRPDHIKPTISEEVDLFN